MKIIINNTSMMPIYEQVVEQIKTMIGKGDLKKNDILPSVRTLSRELKISALTVKKAYDHLEQDGFIVTVHGKGSFVAGVGSDFLLEEKRKEVEADLEMAIQKGIRYGMSSQELRELFDVLMED